MKRALALGILAFLATFCGEDSFPSVVVGINSVTHGGLQRTFLLHVPPGHSRSRPVPLVVGLHGFTSTATSFESQSGLSAKSDEAGFIVAYPNGLPYPWRPSNPQAWNAGGAYERWTGGTDDVGFIGRVIELIRRDYAIDGSRIYVTGHSNGSRMTYRVGYELSCTVAAIAPHSGQMVYSSQSPPPCPVPVLHLHARDDPQVLYDGATTEDPNELSYAPVETVLGTWAGSFGCSTSPRTDRETGDYTVRTWPCPGGSPEIALYLTERGGHHWFRQDNSGLPATDLIWEFFEAHPKR